MTQADLILNKYQGREREIFLEGVAQARLVMQLLLSAHYYDTQNTFVGWETVLQVLGLPLLPFPEVMAYAEKPWEGLTPMSY